MNNDCVIKAGQWMGKFPEVKWDRCAGDRCHLTVFGWIPRDDGNLDFMSISFRKGEPTGYVTSSAEYSAEFAKRIGFESHVDCQPVTDIVGYVKQNKGPADARSFNIIGWQE